VYIFVLLYFLRTSAAYKLQQQCCNIAAIILHIVAMLQLYYCKFYAIWGGCKSIKYIYILFVFIKNSVFIEQHIFIDYFICNYYFDINKNLNFVVKYFITLLH